MTLFCSVQYEEKVAEIEKKKAKAMKKKAKHCDEAAKNDATAAVAPNGVTEEKREKKYVSFF